MFSLQAMNRDFIRASKIGIAATDASFSMETMKQKTCVCLGKLENFNFDLDTKKDFAGASTVSCQQKN